MPNAQYFIAVNPSGECKQYSKGDIVIRNNLTYIAKNTPIPCLPPENKNSGWEQTANPSGINFYNSSTAPTEVKEGDEWFNPSTGKLYKYIIDSDSEQWIQIS
jgi:hypothetical protein